MQMIPESWKQVKALFESALDLAPPQRETYLRQNCPDDAMRREVENLLGDYEKAGNFLSTPAMNFQVAIPREAPEDSATFASASEGEGTSTAAVRLGQALGNYRILSRLGEGGMGQVWLAEQTAPLQRQVALKLIRVGMYDDSVLQRFESERQSLASMNHPSIAKVFDAGTTPDGQPYFAMEYVPGLPITEYCDQNRLTIRERLELFIQVCEGVQHAHLKAIMHRDLKPANILVVEVDGKATPRIIDFGLAKAAQATRDGLLTQVGSFLGTPGYMSPEQANLDVQDIDTRTDVYSLGVVLYELLTGFLPSDTKEGGEALAEMMRRIREDDPPPPSTKIRADRESSTAKAEERGTDPKQLVSLLRGDLDWITMKALERERARRYATPSELTSDIGRYLRHEPVTARPASAGYKLRKYVRRHRLAVSAAVAMALLVAGFAVVQAIQLGRTTRERDRANRITNFMVDMFKVSDPSAALGNKITVREVLDKASNEIEKGLSNDVEVQSQLMSTMAQTYVNLGLFSRAHELAEHALENRKRAFGPRDRRTLESMTQLGWILDREGRDADAERLIRQTVDLQRSVLGPEDVLTLETADNLGMVLERQGHFAEEEKLEREIIATRTRKLGPEHQQTLRSMVNLGIAIHGQDHIAEAEKQFREVLEIERRVLPPGHPSTLVCMHDLANMIQEQGRYQEAEALYRETLQMEERVLGSEHPETFSTMTTLANTIGYGENRSSEAEPLYRKAFENSLRVLGPEHRYTTAAEEGLANALSSQGHYAEAEKLLRELLAIRLRLLGADHADTLLSQYNLGDVLFHEERYAEADKLLRDTWKSQIRMLGDDSPDTLASKAVLARIVTKEGNPREGETLARQAFEAQLRVLGPQHGDTLNSLQILGTALVYDHRYDEAKKLFADSIEQNSKIKAGNASTAWYNFACVAVTANRPTEAIQYLRQSIALGYNDADHLQADDDLKPLRSDPRFAALVSEARRHLPASTPK
ncbi:MAG: tetratricopeptide repeat protein [Terriglobales bacterium]|jgi:eukaryotic-like serine/threonine-protein kinase